MIVRVDLAEDELSFEYEAVAPAILEQFRAQASAFGYQYVQSRFTLTLAYGDGLDLLRELAPLQRQWAFRFVFADSESRERVHEFVERVKNAREHNQGISDLTADELNALLIASGFTRRQLKDHQLRDLRQLASAPHGANFSVPGAGKTTVTLALHLIAMPANSRMLVVAPKSAFTAWEEVVEDCMDADFTPFARLAEDRQEVIRLLRSGHPRLVINYEMAVQVATEVRRYLAAAPSHLVIDESHRIKAGPGSQRGATALALASAAARRDILSGTPMPQGASDIAAQADFLWQGEGLGRAIRNGSSPSHVLAGRFVRTTKRELNLPPREPTIFVPVPMRDGQLALYGILRERTLAQLTQIARTPQTLPQARGAVFRLMQASVNPPLAAGAFSGPSDVLAAAIAEGLSPKIEMAAFLARQNADEGRKTVIWTIFTDTLKLLRTALVDLDAVAIYGGNRDDPLAGEVTRDEALRRFVKTDESMVLVANPAAASEGLSLHERCHEAIYVDRTYNAAHYLQSIDRIHRLGLEVGTVTRVQVLQSVTPTGIGNIDVSISRRLATKARDLGQLLNDPDLAEIAMAEDDADLPVDDSVDFNDVADLVLELQGRAPAQDENF